MQTHAKYKQYTKHSKQLCDMSLTTTNNIITKKLGTPISAKRGAREAGLQTPVQGKNAKLSSTIPDTPMLSEYGSSSSKLYQLMEQRFTKLSEQFDQQFSQIAAKMLHSETKVLNELGSKIDSIRQDLNAVVERVTCLETAFSNIDVLRAEVDVLKSQLAKHENTTVACDIRLNGIPYSKDENLFNMFNFVCNTVNISPPIVKQIFRINRQSNRNNNNNNRNSTDGTIIIKLTTPFDKNNFLKTIAQFKRANNDIMRLHHVGINSDSPIYFNESLTKTNHVILQTAVRFKKQKQLHAVFTMRGIVHVKVTESDTAAYVDSIHKLNSIIGIRSSHNNNHQQNVNITSFRSDSHNFTEHTTQP